MRLRVVGAVDSAFHDRRDYIKRRRGGHGDMERRRKISPASRGDMGPAGTAVIAAIPGRACLITGHCSIMNAVCLGPASEA
jgi:hypothetical protein